MSVHCTMKGSSQDRTTAENHELLSDYMTGTFSPCTFVVLLRGQVHRLIKLQLIISKIGWDEDGLLSHVYCAIIATNFNSN